MRRQGRLMTRENNSGALTLVQGSARTCDWEPIHIPGSIQPHGLLLLFGAATGTLTHRAGDCERLIGLVPTDYPKVDALLGVSIDDLIVACQRNRNDEPVYVGVVRPLDREPLAMMAHRTGRFVVVELMQAEIESSAGLAMDMAGTITQHINASQTLAEACNVAVEQVRAIVGFDSVMVYRFLDDGSGSVIAQSKAARAKCYLGHRFPASDIPRQARALYRRNLIRIIPDVAYQPAPIEPMRDGSPIDMSHCILRSVAPVHIDYMKNMGLGASMSVSLLVDDHLWGLIICHHYEPRQVPVESQLFCRHIGAALSGFVLNFERSQDKLLEALQSEKLDAILAVIDSGGDPERLLRTSSEDIKELIDCTGLVLLDEGELVAGVGDFPDATALRELSSLIETLLGEEQSFSIDRLGEELSDPAIATRASGVLAVRLEAARPLLALWLRQEQIEEIHWAGEPPADENSLGPQKSLTPRKSFATWRELVKGRSRPWMRQEIEAAQVFKTRVGSAMQRHRLVSLNAKLGKANALLSAQATTDALTGLPNRRLFDERLRAEWERARRQKTQIAIAAIDIDHFKDFNDAYGHPAGDECLKQVARAIGSTCRSMDLAARLGGEEFAVLLPEIDAGGAAIVAERLRAIIEGLYIIHPLGGDRGVTISLGIAVASPSADKEALGLLSAADEALYRAKASGRNSVEVSSYV
jgi:two-component system, chemotaxis family, sensor kinase Cph1